MEKFNTNTVKYFATILVIAILLAGLFGYAYQLLSKESSENNISVEITRPIKQKTNTINLEKNEEGIIAIDITEEETSKDFQSETDLSNTKNKLNHLEIITEENSIEEQEKIKPQETNTIEDLLSNAKELTDNQKYSEAISVYEKVLSITDNNEVKSQNLENIAILNAKLKHYGSALSAAQRAFNLNPTTEREILLARLYYKVGDTNRAQARMTNVLKRDF